MSACSAQHGAAGVSRALVRGVRDRERPCVRSDSRTLALLLEHRKSDFLIPEGDSLVPEIDFLVPENHSRKWLSGHITWLSCRRKQLSDHRKSLPGTRKFADPTAC